MANKAKQDRRLREVTLMVWQRFAMAAWVKYSCGDNPRDVTVWSVHNAHGRLLWNSNTATEKSWPELGEFVDAFAPLAYEREDRGDDLRFDLEL
jgi:hypothetical protein